MLTKQLALSTTNSFQTTTLEKQFSELRRKEGFTASLLPFTSTGIQTFARNIADHPLKEILPLCLMTLKAATIYTNLIDKLLREFKPKHIQDYVNTEDIKELHHHMTCFLLYEQITFVEQCLTQLNDNPKKKDALELRLSLYIPSEIAPESSNISFLHLGIIRNHRPLIELCQTFQKALELPVRKRTTICLNTENTNYKRIQIPKGFKAIQLATLFAQKELFLTLLKDECERVFKQGPITKEGIQTLKKELDILVTQETGTHKRTIIETLVDRLFKNNALYEVYTTPLLPTPEKDAELKTSLGWTRDAFIEAAKGTFKVECLHQLLLTRPPLEKATQVRHIKGLKAWLKNNVHRPISSMSPDVLRQEEENAMILFTPWFEGEDKYREISELTRPALLRHMTAKKRADIFIRFIAIFMIEHRDIHDITIEEVQHLLNEFIQDVKKDKASFEKTIKSHNAAITRLKQQKKRYNKTAGQRLPEIKIQAIQKYLTLIEESKKNLKLAIERIIFAKQYIADLSELRTVLNKQLHNQDPKTELSDTASTGTASNTPSPKSTAGSDDYMMLEQSSGTASDVVEISSKTPELSPRSRWQTLYKKLQRHKGIKEPLAIKKTHRLKRWHTFSKALQQQEQQLQRWEKMYRALKTRHFVDTLVTSFKTQNDLNQGDWILASSPTKGSRRWQRLVHNALQNNLRTHRRTILNQYLKHRNHFSQTWSSMTTHLTNLQKQRQRTTLFKAYKEEKDTQAVVRFQAHIRGQQTRQWFESEKYNLVQQQLKREQVKIQALHKSLQIIREQNVQLMANAEKKLNFREKYAEQLIRTQEADGPHIYHGQFLGHSPHGEIVHTYPTGIKWLEIWANGQFVIHLFEIQD